MSTMTWLDLPVPPFARNWTMPTNVAAIRQPASKLDQHQTDPSLDIYEDGVVDLIRSADSLGRSIAESFRLEPLAA